MWSGGKSDDEELASKLRGGWEGSGCNFFGSRNLDQSKEMTSAVRPLRPLNAMQAACGDVPWCLSLICIPTSLWGGNTL